MDNENTATNGTELGVFQRIIAVFTSPAQAFASIEVKPKTIVPLIVVAVISIAFVLIASDIIKNEALTQQEMKMQEQGMDPAQIEQALGMTESFIKYTTPVFAVIMPVLIIAVVAAVFLFMGNVILGGKSNFKQVFSVTAWSWLILSLYSLVTLPLVMAKKTMLVSFSLAAFMSDEAQNTFLFKLLSKVDIFFIWWVAVVSIGLAVIYKMKTQKVATAVGIAYVIFAVVASALGSMFA